MRGFRGFSKVLVGAAGVAGLGGKTAGLAESEIPLVKVAEGALVSSYPQGAGDTVGMPGGLDDKPAEIKTAGGAAPVGLAYSDYGVNQVGYCIVTAKDTVKNKPDLV